MGLISGEHGVRNQERSLRRKYSESCCFTLKGKKKTPKNNENAAYRNCWQRRQEKQRINKTPMSEGKEIKKGKNKI